MLLRGPIDRFGHYYGYRFTWYDGEYTWQNGNPPSPIGSSSSEEEVDHKKAYWADYFLSEIRVSLKERRLLPKELCTHHVVTRIAEFLGTVYDVYSEDVVASSTPPGSSAPGSVSTAV